MWEACEGVGVQSTPEAPANSQGRPQTSHPPSNLAGGATARPWGTSLQPFTRAFTPSSLDEQKMHPGPVTTSPRLVRTEDWEWRGRRRPALPVCDPPPANPWQTVSLPTFQGPQRVPFALYTRYALSGPNSSSGFSPNLLQSATWLALVVHGLSPRSSAANAVGGGGC